MTEFISSQTLRLDQELAAKLQVSRNQVASLIKNGSVSVNGKIVTKAGFALNLGDKISLIKPQITPIQSEFKAEFDVEILYDSKVSLKCGKEV